MDNLILEGVVRILARDLPGAALLRAERAAEWTYRLRLAPASAGVLAIGLRPPHGFLHRAGSLPLSSPLPPDPFVSLLSRELEGAVLERVGRPRLDRVVDLAWETPAGAHRFLVAELLGKSANLLLLDEERIVLGYAREMASAFRAPAEGRPYQPPVPRRGMEEITLDPARAGEYLQRFAGKGPAGEAAEAFLRGLSPPLAEDFRLREEAAEDPAAALASLLAASAEGRFEPCLYTALDPDLMLERPAASLEAPVLSPFPLRAPPLPVETRCPDAEEASRLATRLEECLRLFRETRERLGAALDREAHKLERLQVKLREELEQAGRAEEHRRFGDLILAHPAARVEGAFISVRDLYDPQGRELKIPADPALSPREQAERHYARARKLERGAKIVRERVESVGARVERVGEWRRRLESVQGDEDLAELERDLRQARILPPPTGAPARKARLRPEGDPGIRKFRTADGFLILVGRTAADNDRLTFQMASPRDFWLHAADRSGAHVVVRNPGKLKELPGPALLAAAQIAAHFSRARGKGKVEVHYTLRKHVRKGRGFPVGMVTLRNHRTLNVEPALPGQEGS